MEVKGLSKKHVIEVGDLIRLTRCGTKTDFRLVTRTYNPSGTPQIVIIDVYSGEQSNAYHNIEALNQCDDYELVAKSADITLNY